MSELYALSGNVETWLALPQRVPEQEWQRMVQLALSRGRLKEAGIQDAARIEGDERRIWGHRVPAEPGNVAFEAFLAECVCARWRPATGGRFFFELSEDGPSDEGAPEKQAAWSALLELGRDQRRPDSELPDWLRHAYPDMFKGLASPPRLQQILAQLDAHDVLAHFMELLKEEDKASEAKDVKSLVEFIRLSADQGHWVLGTEWGS
ncbi:MAG TPA: hypothetical protein V6D23_08065 [Candidatus Obscuribacterales bacterium]